MLKGRRGVCRRLPTPVWVWVRVFLARCHWPEQAGLGQAWRRVLTAEPAGKREESAAELPGPLPCVQPGSEACRWMGPCGGS